MTETPNNQQHSNGQDQMQYTIAAQYIKDLSFENPRPQDVLRNLKDKPEMNISVNVKVNPVEEGKLYEVELHIQAQGKQKDKVNFVIDLCYAGIVATNITSKEHLHPLLLIETPRLLFPFARNIIADTTRDGGFPPLFRQPIDFLDLYRRNLAQQKQPEASNDTGTEPKEAVH